MTVQKAIARTWTDSYRTAKLLSDAYGVRAEAGDVSGEELTTQKVAIAIHHANLGSKQAVHAMDCLAYSIRAARSIDKDFLSDFKGLGLGQRGGQPGACNATSSP